MRRDRPARRSILWLALAALSIVGCGEELPTPAGAEDGFERTVLAELFTAVWCGNCPIAEAALDRLVDEEGIGRLAVIHWHPSFGAGDPLSIPAADERVGFYESLIGQQPGLPVNVFNGALGISQGTRETYGLYRSRFEIEAALRSPVAIAIEPSLAGSQVDALVRVSGFPGCGSLGLDLHLVAVEHHAPNPGRTGPALLSYTARAATAATVEVQGGQSRALSLALPLDPGWKREDLFLVAFVQEPAPAAGRTFREVLQARMVPLVEEGEDFRAFLLSAADTDRGVARNATSALPWRAHNVGTLADTLEIDLPAELQSLPEGWTAALSDEEGGVLALPRREALAPGGMLAGLRLSVTAAESGEASLALCARSIGDPALADTLRFRLTAGDFGFLLASAATEVRAVAGQTARVDFSAANTGTLADSLAFTLPAELNGLPAGWTATLASAQGHALGAAHTLHLPAGGSPATLGLAVTPGGEGEGALAVVARSRYAPEKSDTLRFQVRSRLYAVALSAPAAEVWAVVGRPASIAFSALNRSTRADIVTLDVPAALQSLPSGWRLELAGLDGVPVAVPRSLLIEAGCSHALLALLVTPAGPGSARVRLTAASAGDPRAADTLSLTVRADAYGLDISAPEGTALPLAPGATKLAPLRLANTGTLGDTLVLDLPAALMQLPAGWQADLVTAGGTQLYLP
ncbi:MAG: hypothetical protein FJY75_12525, partial [Candidatus Eisenbacteria bacterium]|nr:hypothetical protein [Candidatus Eisenbacteria bacterium]